MRGTMSRPRNSGNNDLPSNLTYTLRKGGKRDGQKYYMYKHPVSGKKHGMGYDKAEAVEAAKEVNAVLGVGSNLVSRVTGNVYSNTTLGQFIDKFINNILPARRIKGQPLSAAYIRESKRIFGKIAEGLGANRPMASIQQKELSSYLNTIESADASNQHRIRLIQLWRHAMSDEVVSENLPEKVIRRDNVQRQRERLTLEWYIEIFKHARFSIQCAMELSLNSLQRRADVRKWRFDDQVEEYAQIIQQKTRKHGPSAWLRIPLDLPTAHSDFGADTLGQLITVCRDDIPCPYLVHERPERIRKCNSKKHPFQLSEGAISRGFAVARDKTGLFDKWEKGTAPTFHEILSLGQYLRQQQGWSKQQRMLLRGHTSESTTEIYDEGHTWTTFEVPNTVGQQ